MIANAKGQDNGKGGTLYIVSTVMWRCPDCGFEFSERQMKDAAQQYVAQNPDAIQNGIRSFFVNAFSSPWVTWPEIMKEWLEARGDPEREKVVMNTRFGESYEQIGAFENEQIFLKRREVYRAELPDGVLVLTAAVDTQDNRLEYEIAGWGRGEERWGIQKGVLLGVPDSQNVWNQLDIVLDKVYHFADGRGLTVTRTFIDSGGHYGDAVYEYCRQRHYQQRFAVKGASISGQNLIYKYSKASLKSGGTIPLVLLGVDSGKQYIMDRLSMELPGAKTMHFPLDDMPTDSGLTARGYDEIYFKGLISEQLVPRKVHGQVVYRWENVAKDRRNEPLDLAVYNLACLHSLPISWETLEAALKAGTTEPVKAVSKKPKTYGRIRKGVRYDE